tara:strand:+ start:382 stop:981 length:600 start_codon:yes stop_codon:yes gene_type:complete
MKFPFEDNDVKVANSNDLKRFQIISVKNFCNVNFDQRIEIDKSIENNFFQPSTLKYKSGGTHNFPIKYDDTFFFSDLYLKFFHFCYEIFDGFEISVKNKNTPWCYRSNKFDYESVWHSHFFSSTINGVYYYSIDNDGIYFEKDGEIIYYLPEQNELLIFPNYLNHKPEVATSEKLRYSINMEIVTEETSLTLFERYGLP